MLTLRRYRLIYFHLALGLLVIPFGLGHFDTGDFLVRVPAILVVALDAGTAFMIAWIYHRKIWPHKATLPTSIRNGIVPPGTAWLAAIGYYIICVWVTLAIVARPDGHVDWSIAVFFLAGFVFVGVYKMYMVRMVHSMDEALNG